MHSFRTGCLLLSGEIHLHLKLPETSTWFNSTLKPSAFSKEVGHVRNELKRAACELALFLFRSCQEVLVDCGGCEAKRR